MPRLRVVFLLVCWVGAVGVGMARAQWHTQTTTLQPGWNAVYLGVDPSPTDPASVFQGVPLAAVWGWNLRFSTVEYIQDPSTLVPEQPEWLHYFPPSTGNDALTNLFAVRGGQAYLVKVRGPNPVPWTVVGRPVSKPVGWVPDSFNLVGFPVEVGGNLTLSTFFAGSTAHTPLETYRLDSGGHWVAMSPTDPLEAGRAYWVRCQRGTAWQGPLSVHPPQGGGLDYGKLLVEQTLRFRNDGDHLRTVTLTPVASDSPPGTGLDPVAGEVPLQYWDDETRSWAVFAGPVQVAVPQGGEAGLRLAVRRSAMAAGPGLYQSLLSVADGEGVRWFVPVMSRAREGASAAQAGGGVQLLGAGSVVPEAGLWVGTASIDRVSQPADTGAPDTPKPTAAPFQVRLLVHVDAGGQARLLRQAFLGWKPGVVDAQTGAVLTPGRYVVLTRDDPALTSQFEGTAVRDGTMVGRAIRSAAFSFRDPVAMAGTLDGSLSCTLTVPYDDPLNPFVHPYHPDHDNRALDFTTPLGPGVESYDITRTITLTASATDPTGLPTPGWGDTVVGGSYGEAITGVHRSTIRVAGIYRLERLVLTPVLNDGLP